MCRSFRFSIFAIAVSATSFAQTPPPRDEAVALLKQAGELRTAGRLDEAIDAARRAEDIGRRIHEPAIEAEAVLVPAMVALVRLKPEEARVPAERAAALADRLADDRLIAMSHDTLARALADVGRRSEAMVHLERAIRAADAVGTPALRINPRNVLTTLRLRDGRIADALAMGQESYAIAATLPPRFRASATFTLAQAYGHIWDNERAERLATEAIDFYRQNGPPVGVPLMLAARMHYWYHLGELDRSYADGLEAITLFETLKVPTPPLTFSRLATIDARRGRLADMDGWIARALALMPSDPPSRDQVVHHFGEATLFAHRPDEAARWATRAIEESRRSGTVEGEWRGLLVRGRAEIELGRPADAERTLAESIRIVERLRETVPEAGLRATFMSKRVEPYEAMIDALMAQSAQPASTADSFSQRAFETAERARARSLADLLAESRSGPAVQDDALARSLKPVVERLSSVQRALKDESNAAVRAVRLREVADAEQAYDNLVYRWHREQPVLASAAFPRSLTRDEIARSLGPGDVLVEFAFTDRGGYAWAASGERLLSYRIPDRDAMAAQVARAQAWARSAGAGSASAQDWYRWLFAGAEPLMESASRLLIVPDGPLHRMPFALLRDNSGRWLIDRLAISIVPSASMLPMLARPTRDAAEPLLAIAASRDEGLPAAAGEAREAARMLGAPLSAVRVGAQATEAALKARAGSPVRVVHFATHTVIDESVPRRSAVLVPAGAGEDGMLQVHEIARLALSSDLVVLASCDTQTGRDVRGEGLLSLSRAFIQAGARAVVATLWPVDDQQTEAFMRAFYLALRRGAPPDRALVAAQQSMIRAAGASALPVNWAGFVITGSAGQPIFTPVKAPRDRWAATGSASVAAFLIGFLVIGYWMANREAAATMARPSGPRRSTNHS